MANVKITELTALTNPASSDVLPIVDVGADTTKKVTIADLLENAGSGSASAPAFAFDGDSNTGMYRPGANELALATGGAARLFIDSAGNIGVSTSSPLEKLHVTAGSSGVSSAIGGVDGVIIESGAGRTGGLLFYTPNDRAAGIFFGDPDSNNKAAYRYNHSNDSTEIISNGSQRLLINSLGNVGIGTSSPSSNLEIENNGATTLRLTRTNSVSNYCLFEASGSNSELLKIETDPTGTGGGVISFKNGGSEKVRINAAGNVGIGTTSPAQLLHLEGVNPRLRITDSDTTSATSNSYIEFHGSDARSAVIYTDSSGFNIQADSAGAGPLRFLTSGTQERVRISSSGRLLINTSTSRTNLVTGTLAAQLQVEGTNHDASSGSFIRNSNDVNNAFLTLGKTRGTANGSNTIVQNSDGLGNIAFLGADGTNLIRAAEIKAIVDGTPGTNDMPGALLFSTTADGASSPTERMRISSAGVVTINSGFVTLNGSKVGGIQVTIADDAFAEITPPKAGAGFVAVTEGPDEVFPNSPCHGFVYCDWGDSPDVANVHLGSAFETSNLGPPTGTTGSDDHATLFAGGTSGKVYLENRLGATGIFALTFT